MGRRLRKGIAVLLPINAVAATVAVGISAGPAGASCPNGGNYNSTACYGDSNSNFQGSTAQFHSNNMYLSAADYADRAHINNEMWFYTHPDLSQWVETGLRNGYDPTDPCVCVAYEAFWAEFDSAGSEFRHTIVNTTPNGDTHVYEVQYGGNDHWNVYRDFNLVGTSKYQGSNRAYVHQAGLEVTRGSGAYAYVDPTAHADTFDNYMQVRVGNTWKNWPAWDYWLDHGCGGAYATGYCLNGVSYASNEWSDNKP